jgi:hypothetical protein
MTIEQHIWQHPPRPGQPDFRGQARWVLSDDDGFVLDHFETEAEAVAASESGEYE